ncbi:hypothetical protein FQ087_19335 [Sporosarcina sp. ANT_H38]|uniref:hypothetical protein n=1 Tax=Sporosarcina sp. ANT_H38 TaxID=2597358 RepID=UPI0011F1F942|nr:hypothetical protein [Sporosarcina sp. ANT_H38]KAA0944268.1 hypothetical protein FQ087_19335 [Sporosarcina sp. ANT_H38]
MDGDTERNVRLKEIIFNEKKYSKTKKALTIFYLVLLFYSQVKQNEVLGFSLTFSVIIVGIIYLISKIYFYNEKKKNKDILLLILFVALLLWGVYTFYVFYNL